MKTHPPSRSTAPPASKPQTTDWPCTICGSRFRDIKLLNQHNKDMGHFRCRLCGKALKSQDGLETVYIWLSLTIQDSTEYRTKHISTLHASTKDKAISHPNAASGPARQFDWELDDFLVRGNHGRGSSSHPKANIPVTSILLCIFPILVLSLDRQMTSRETSNPSKAKLQVLQVRIPQMKLRSAHRLNTMTDPSRRGPSYE